MRNISLNDFRTSLIKYSDLYFTSSLTDPGSPDLCLLSSTDASGIISVVTVNVTYKEVFFCYYCVHQLKTYLNIQTIVPSLLHFERSFKLSIHG